MSSSVAFNFRKEAITPLPVLDKGLDIEVIRSELKKFYDEGRVMEINSLNHVVDGHKGLGPDLNACISEMTNENNCLFVFEGRFFVVARRDVYASEGDEIDPITFAKIANFLAPKPIVDMLIEKKAKWKKGPKKPLYLVPNPVEGLKSDTIEPVKTIRAKIKEIFSFGKKNKDLPN